MGPRISALIGVYNGIPYLKRAIDSVLAQEYPAHEIIIVDDGSTDGTLELLASYGGRIKVRRIAPSGSPAAPKNTAMTMATGDYLAFLDHDDFWFRHKLRRQAELIRRYPETGLVCCDFYVRYGYLGRRLVRHYDVLPFRQLINFDEPLRRSPMETLLEGNFIGVPSAVVIKKSLADAAGPFDAGYRNSQDYDYWMRCAPLASSFLVMSEPLLYKMNHPGNISANPVRQWTFRRRILADTLTRERAYLDEHGLTGRARLALAKADYFLGNLHFEAGDRREAFRLYARGLGSDPTPRNLALYLSASGRKLVRLASGDLISRKRWRKDGRS